MGRGERLNSACIWEFVNCVEFPNGDDMNCPVRVSDMGYSEKKPTSIPIIDVECHRQGDLLSNNDCDFVYYWESSNSVYENYENITFYWRNDYYIYRTIFYVFSVGSNGLSGFRDATPNRFGAFMGNAHVLTLNFVWNPDIYECPQDLFMLSTSFNYEYNTTGHEFN